ncbi:phosphohydrolase [Exilibacterium tricleocarpae]|uniref:Phosphohydrolase n=1 Tax=Exilibacterium tricleocarpae TaxID=2591008 RepID=A0A545TN73_9GAMM|nr:cytochrome c biogenesis protein CcsA [Exilibacterium tricleocarpae]TQV78677.1 phosphohydrolase [Exilibacterium tricleocarpae]
MLTLAFNAAAIALYLAASGYLISQLLSKQAAAISWLRSFALSALVFHGMGVFSIIFSPEGYNLGFLKVSSMIFWVINLLVLASSLKKPLHNLFVFLFPLSALSVGVSLFSTSPITPYGAIGIEIVTHIFLSFLAYSLLTIATLQALLLAYQNYQLRHKHPMGMTRVLPPLQTMETLLFELLWAGELLLTLSILTGFLFLEDLFAQHLVHKTAFSLLAWAIYAILLWGRHRSGWRGTQAVRWTLGGFVALMLAYFGTKLVLEIILA